MQVLIDQSHSRHHSSHNRAHRGEERSPSFPVFLHNLYVKRWNFVEEEYARQTPATSRIDMPQMLRNTELVRFYYCAIEELITSWDNLNRDKMKGIMFNVKVETVVHREKTKMIPLTLK